LQRKPVGGAPLGSHPSAGPPAIDLAIAGGLWTGRRRSITCVHCSRFWAHCRNEIVRAEFNFVV
jgi:hypothetical protein